MELETKLAWMRFATGQERRQLGSQPRGHRVEMTMQFQAPLWLRFPFALLFWRMGSGSALWLSAEVT